MNHQNLPDTIILDLDDAVAQFDRRVGELNHHGSVYACEVMNTILNYCLRNKHQAELFLREFVDEVAYAVHMQSSVGVDIRPQDADAVMELGRATMAHVNMLNLYDTDGELLYEHNIDVAPYHKEVVVFRIQRGQHEHATP